MAPLVSLSDTEWTTEEAKSYIDVSITIMSTAGVLSVLVMTVLLCGCCKKRKAVPENVDEKRRVERPPLLPSAQPPPEPSASRRTITPTPTGSSTPRAVRETLTKRPLPEDAPPLVLNSWMMDKEKPSSPIYDSRHRPVTSPPTMPSLELMSLHPKQTPSGQRLKSPEAKLQQSTTMSPSTSMPTSSVSKSVQSKSEKTKSGMSKSGTSESESSAEIPEPLKRVVSQPKKPGGRK